MTTKTTPPHRKYDESGLREATCSAVLDAAERLSRDADKEWGHEQFARKRMVKYGPLTTQIAREVGLPVAKARYHLTVLWRAGKLQKHLSYTGCIASWYVLPNADVDARIPAPRKPESITD